MNSLTTLCKCRRPKINRWSSTCLRQVPTNLSAIEFRDWPPVRKTHDYHALRLEDLIEAGGELGVPIAEQEVDLQAPILEHPGQVPRLLGHPGASRLIDAAGEVNAPRPTSMKNST